MEGGIVGDKRTNTTVTNCHNTYTTATVLNASNNKIWLEDGKILNQNGEIVDNLDNEGNLKYINEGYPILKWEVENKK